MASKDFSSVTSVMEYFDERSKTYERDGYSAFHFELSRRLVTYASLSRGQRLLDVATGTGLVAISAAQSVGPEGSVIGADISAGMLSVAERKAREMRSDNVRFVRAPANKMPFPDGSFDRILCCAAIVYMPNILSALIEWKRLMAPGGVLVFDAPTRGSSVMGTAIANAAQEIGITLDYTKLYDEESCRRTISEAGLRAAELHIEYFEPIYFARDMFDAVWEHGLRNPLSRALNDLPMEGLAKLRAKVYGDLFYDEQLNSVVDQQMMRFARVTL